MKVFKQFLTAFVVLIIPSIVFGQTSIFTTRVNETLKRQINSEGKFTTIEMADGTSFSTAPLGGNVVGPSSSVDSEIALYNSTTGKLLKRFAGTGILTATSGVISTATTTGTGNVVLATGAQLANVSLDGITLQNFGGWTYGSSTSDTQAGTHTTTVSGGGYVITGTPLTIDAPTADTHALQMAQLNTHAAALNPHNTSKINRAYPLLSYDCFTATATPFSGSGILGGQTNVTTGLINRPGIIEFLGFTTANAGYYIRVPPSSILPSGGEFVTADYSLVSGTTTTRIGFFDTNSVTVGADNAHILFPGTTTAWGYTSSNSVGGTTTTSYQTTVDTWYQAKVLYNDNASSVTFTLLNEVGTILWTDSLDTNIGTTTGRELGAGIISTSAGTQTPTLINLDYLSLGFNKELVR